MSDLGDRELLEALGVEAVAVRASALTARQERAIAGFEDILRFTERCGRPPARSETSDVFERLYALRLDSLRGRADLRELLEPFDRQGLLKAPALDDENLEAIDDEILLAQLGVQGGGGEDINQLRHVRSRAETSAAEEIARRKPCEDFDGFEPLFEAVQRDLKSGARRTRQFREDATIRQGEFFILGGQIAYVAEVPEEVDRTEYGHAQGRLRVIYDNGTEGDNLLRSFVRALYKDETGRRISEPQAGPLFGDQTSNEDLESGTIYVLRSRSSHPVVTAHRDLIHKVGVTGGTVQGRIANARHDPTYLMAAVDVVAEYSLYNINRVRLERLLHRVFAPARLDLALPDRFGKDVQPREWFLAPLSVIDEAVVRIKDGSITEFRYDPASAALVENHAVG